MRPKDTQKGRVCRLLEPSQADDVSSALVYSTCSLSRAQNEDVVAWLLREAPNAQLVPIDAACLTARGPEGDEAASETKTDGARAAWPCRESSFLPHALRFDPFISGTSGLFIAKLVKTQTK